MGRKGRLALSFAPFLFIGVFTVINFSGKLLESSENVRVAHLIGLSSGGAVCGLALAGIVFALTGKLKLDKQAIPADTRTVERG